MANSDLSKSSQPKDSFPAKPKRNAEDEAVSYQHELPPVQPGDTVWQSYKMPQELRDACQKRKEPKQADQADAPVPSLRDIISGEETLADMAFQGQTMCDPAIQDRDKSHVSPQTHAIQDRDVSPSTQTQAIQDMPHVSPSAPTQVSTDRSDMKSETSATPAKSTPSFTTRYQILTELGRGGMGVVYKVHDQELKREVALKVVHAFSAGHEKEHLGRFLREAKAMAQLHHPHIVTIFDMGMEKEVPFFTMELIQGVSFRQYLQNTTPRNLRESVDILRKVAIAVHYAHTQGIIHRDLKPANIMICQDKEPKVMDFGLAKWSDVQESLSQSGELLGTPVYMAPEQAQSEPVDARSDVYSLGATLYEILTSRAPFQGETSYHIIHQVIMNDPIAPRSLNPEISNELEAICLKAMEKNPNKRYQSAELFAQDIANFLECKPISAKSPTVWTYTSKFVRRNKIAVSAAVLILMAILLGGIVSFIQWKKAEKQQKIAEQEREQAKNARNIAEQEEKKAQLLARQKAEDARYNRIRLAQIALIKAEEAYTQQKWAECGVYAGNAMEDIKGLEKCEKLREKSRDFIVNSLFQQGILCKIQSYGHPGSVISLTWSPDGKIVASGSTDRSVRLWEVETGKLVASFSGNADPSWSPDGNMLACVDGNTVKLLHPQTGKSVTTLQYSTREIYCTSWSPDGKTLASGRSSLDNRYGIVTLLEVETGKIIDSYQTEELLPFCVSWSPDGKTLASGTKDNSVRLWEVSTGKVIAKFQGHTDVIYSLSWDYTGKTLASGSFDNTVKLWEVSTGKLISTLDGHTDSVWSVAFNPDGNTLASVSKDGTVRLWKVETGKKITTFKDYTSPNCVTWSPDGKTLAFGGREILKLYRGEEDKSTFTVSTFDFFRRWSPDGKMLALGGYGDNTVRLCEVATGRTIAIFHGHRSIVRDAIWSPDRKILLSYDMEYCENDSVNMNVKSWDVTTGQKIATLNTKTIVSTADVYGSTADACGYWSPDRKVLACASDDNTLGLWELASGKKLIAFQGHTGTVSCFSWHPDGKILASGSNDKTVKLWEVGTGKNILSLQHETEIGLVSWSPDGKTLVSRSRDKRDPTFNTLKLWDVETGKNIATLQAGPLSWSPDGKTLAAAGLMTRTPSSGKDPTVKLWRVPSGENIATFQGHTSEPRFVSWSPDGTILASVAGAGDNTLRLWKAATGTNIATFPLHSDEIISPTWSPDGKMLAVGLKLWNIKTPKPIQNLQAHRKAVFSVQWSPDGKTLVSGSGDKTVKLWEARTGKNIATFQGHSKEITSVSWSPNGKILASASPDKTIRLWEASTGNLIATFQEHTDIVFSLSWSSDGKTLMSASFDKTLKLWEVSTGKCIATFQGHTGQVYSVSWSPNGKVFASASMDRTIRLWEASTGKSIATFQGHTEPVFSVSWSPDGKTLASGSQDKTVKLWEAETGKNIATFHGHSKEITSVSWSPNGKILASASPDKTIRLWEPTTSRLITTLEHTNSVYSVSWSPDGKSLASASEDKSVKLWEVEAGLEIDHPILFAHSVSYSPDSTTMALHFVNHAELWDLTSGRLVRKTKTIPPSFSQPQPVRSWEKSTWDVQRDIPGWILEMSLQKYPQKITESLWELRVNTDLSLQNMPLRYLWDPEESQPQSLSAFYHKQHQDTIEYCTYVLQREPKIAALYARRGLAFLTLGKTKEAMADFNQVAQIEPLLIREIWQNVDFKTLMEIMKDMPSQSAALTDAYGDSLHGHIWKAFVEEKKDAIPEEAMVFLSTCDNKSYLDTLACIYAWQKNETKAAEFAAKGLANTKEKVSLLLQGKKPTEVVR